MILSRVGLRISRFLWVTNMEYLWAKNEPVFTVYEYRIFWAKNEPFLMVNKLMKFRVLMFCGRFWLLIDESNEQCFE